MTQVHRFVMALFCIGGFVSWTLGLQNGCFAQPSDQQEQAPVKRFPYQRVFVPSNDLESMDKDELRPVEVKRLEELLEKYEKSNRENLDGQFALDNQGPVELVTSFYVAKLVGADLLSDRSRLSFVGEFRGDVSVGLRPWSLALQPTTNLGTRGEATESLRWSFDGLGMPRIAAMPNVLDTIQGAKRPRASWTQFGWSLKSLADSSTNKLKFAFDIPKCANSCLVLALPPQAIIEDCSTAVTQVEDWTTIDKRLSDWSDFSQGRSREQTLLRASESLWLIELGGSSSASFSITLSNSSRTKEDLSTSDFQPYKQLVASQTVEHFLEEHLIRTTCEANVFVTPNQLLRISAPKGSKVRRLTVNQQEVDWGIEDGWIQWRRNNAGIASGRADIISFESFTPMPIDKLGHFELPRIVFDRSYVMSGTNIVHCDSFWKLTHCECESAQISEASTEPRSNGVTRVEHSWYAVPPVQAIGLSQIKAERRSEVLTRFTNEANGINALVRVRFSFNEQDSSETSVIIEPNWQLKSVQSLDPNDGLVVESKVNPKDSNGELHFTWGRIQKSRVADIELRLHRDVERTSMAGRRIDDHHLLQLPGWKRSDTIIVENSPSFDFRLKEPLLDSLANEETLADWQKAYLPKSDKHYVFRLDEPVSNGQTLMLPNSKLETTKLDSVVCLANPPVLEWNAKPNPLNATISTEVGWANANELSINHQLHLELGSAPDEWISIRLPGNYVEWRLKDGDKWISIEPRKTTPSPESETVWQLDSKSLGTECTLMAIVHSELSEAREVAFRLPEILHAEASEKSVKSVEPDIAIQDMGHRSEWKIDAFGAKVLNVATAPEAKPLELIAKVDKPNQTKGWMAITSQLQVAVDTLGKQKATLELHSINAVQGPMAITLNEGWEPQSVRQTTSRGSENIPFRVEAGRLIISPDSAIVGGLGIHVELIGPLLPKRIRLTTLESNLEFQWPVIRPEATCIEHRYCLWLPTELQVEGGSGRLLDSEVRYWPIWSWSQAVAGSILAALRMPADSEESPSKIAKTGPLPDWATSHWYLAINTVTPLEFGVGYQSVSIVSGNSGRVAIAVFFVLFTLITPRLILSKYPVATGAAIFWMFCIHFGPRFFIPISYASLLGMSFGFVAIVLYALVAKSKSGDSSVSQKNSGRLSAWDDRGADSGSIVPQTPIQSATPFGTIGICLAVGWLAIGAGSSIASVAQNQAELNNGQELVYQVVIPMDDDGNMVGSTVYVPNEMLDALNGKVPRSQISERATQPTAAKYSMRLGTRGRGFGVTDQITMVYEFLVGEDLESVRFPINVTQLQFPRFSVDGVELSLGARLRSNGSEWIWTPEKPGRRVVTIVAQPILKSNDNDRNRESIVQALDIAVLPMSNAQIEIETDSQSSIDVISKGRVTDPAAGRFVAMLGAVDRLQCTVTTPLSKAGAFGNPSNNQTESSDAPIMNTELFMQGDLLQARTIVDFPKGVSIGQEIEIEADSQWTPIGISWGDAEWIETRPGSTLGRKRYLLEWKNTAGNLTAAAARDRQIAVIWVPQSSNTILNVLFAECRDRRTRRGTLRYSRIDSNWNLEGVSTWVPAIGPRDRLVWPEMNISPIATSLRIPTSGGFGGVLKHKLRTERAQARVTTKWNIQSNRETLTSIIELRGSVPSSEAFYLELPQEFAVTELSNGNGPIRYLPSISNGKLRLQLLADRKSLEVSNLIVQARRLDLARYLRTTDDKEWHELPWIMLPTSINADQSLEVTASESVVMRLELDSNLILGRGQNVPTLNFNKSNSDLHAGALAASRYQVIDRNEPLHGQLTVRSNSLSSQREIEVLGKFTQTVLSRPSIVLEVPAALKDRLQSELKVKTIPCPDPRKAWIQIQLPESPKNIFDSTPNNTDKSLISLIRFSPKPDESTNDDELIRNIVALDDELTAVYELNGERGSQLELAPTTDDKEGSQGNAASWLTQWSLSIRNLNLQSSSTERSVLLESEFWFAGAGEESHGSRKLEWQFSEDSEVLSIAINGIAIEPSTQGLFTSCTITQAGLCASVVVYSKHRIRVDADRDGIVTAPKLLGTHSSLRPILSHGFDFDSSASHDGKSKQTILTPGCCVMWDGKQLTETPLNQTIGTKAQLCVKMIEDSLSGLNEAGPYEPASYAGRWQRYWFKLAQSTLETWANLPDTDDQESYSNVVNRWHSLLDQEPLEKSAEEISISNIDLPRKEQAVVDPKTIGKGHWISFVGCLCVLISLHQLVRLRAWFAKRPWWYLLALGGFVWIVCGTVIPALVLGGIGLAVAADSYWIVTSRLRRTGTRGLPSL